MQLLGEVVFTLQEVRLLLLHECGAGLLHAERRRGRAIEPLADGG